MTANDTLEATVLDEAAMTTIEQRVRATEPLHLVAFDYMLTETDVRDLMAARGVAIPPRSRTPTRDEIIAERAEKGEDLAAIGKGYGMSRERVRQIVSATSVMSNADIREARRRRREGTRTQIEGEKSQHVRRLAAEHPQATLSTLATMTGYPVTLIRDALDWTERERRADQQTYSSIPDAEVLAEIRRVAALPGGVPLTSAFYDEHRTAGVSHARLLQRFKTWTAACEAAQVTPRRPNPGRAYTHTWTNEQMIDWVWAYLTATETPTYAQFEAWMRAQESAPSAQTVRNSIGSWVQMKRLAIEAHAATSH